MTPRRWIHQANPALSNLITETLKTDTWLTDLSQLAGLRYFYLSFSVSVFCLLYYSFVVSPIYFFFLFLILLENSPKILISKRNGEKWNKITRYINFEQFDFVSEKFIEIKFFFFFFFPNCAKKALVNYIKNDLGINIPSRGLFDVQIKRIHEYKRQFMNILSVVHRYLCLKRMTEDERIAGITLFFVSHSFILYLES